MASKDDLIEKAKRVFTKGFDAVLQIEAKSLETFFVDGRGETCTILTAKPKNATVGATWFTGADTLQRLFTGGRGLEKAYLSGRLLISGDMSIMARLELADPNKESTS